MAARVDSRLRGNDGDMSNGFSGLIHFLLKSKRFADSV
jgi:hypothetical protein